VHQLRGWIVRGGGRVERVCELPDQHVFRVGGVDLPTVPGERDVGGGECLAGILLLQKRVCACGGRVHLPDMRSRDVEQSVGTYGVLKLLGGSVFCALRGDRQRDVLVMSARAVVARGQPELQLVSCELIRCCKELLANRLCLQRRVRGAERRRVHCKNEPDLLCMSCEQLRRARTVRIMHE
jgi:hypothetical protein